MMIVLKFCSIDYGTFRIPKINFMAVFECLNDVHVRTEL